MFSENAPGLVKFQSSSLSYNDENKMLIKGDTGMIEQTALVVNVESGNAWIIPQQGMGTGGCGSCSSKTSCSSSTPFDFLRKEPQKMRVLNPVYARPGDTVVVGIQGNALLVYSLLAYLLPLVGLVLAAIVGQEVFSLAGLAGDLGAVLGGVAGLLGGLRLANLVVSRSFNSSVSQPVILRVVSHAGYASILPLA